MSTCPRAPKCLLWVSTQTQARTAMGPADPRAPLACYECSGLVMDGLQAVDRRWDALVARFQLQRKKLRVVARLMQIAAVEP